MLFIKGNEGVFRIVLTQHLFERLTNRALLTIRHRDNMPLPVLRKSKSDVKKTTETCKNIRRPVHVSDKYSVNLTDVNVIASYP